jgi:hypothetical protein
MDEAKRQFYRLSRVFVPIPPPDATEEFLNALCCAGNVATVKELGDRLMAGHPHDKDGLKRAYFPNTAHIAGVIQEIERERAHRVAEQHREWKGFGGRSILEEDWHVPELTANQEALARLRTMRDHPERSPRVQTAKESFKALRAAEIRAFAVAELRKAEDYLGEAIG